jgi:hypothetical protein
VFGSASVHPLAAHIASMKAHSRKQLSIQLTIHSSQLLPRVLIEGFVNDLPVWHINMLRSSSIFDGVHWRHNAFNNPATLGTLRDILVTYLMDFQCRGIRRSSALAHMIPGAYGDIHHIFQEMNTMNAICRNNAEEWATRNPSANDGDMDAFKNIHTELDTDLMDSYIHLSHGALASKHFDILVWQKDDEKTFMPVLHLQLFENCFLGKPDINILINNNRQLDGLDMFAAIPKHGYIRSGTVRTTQSCDLDVAFRLHRRHAYGYIPNDSDTDGSDMDEDDEDNDDDEDDSQGMDGGGGGCAE